MERIHEWLDRELGVNVHFNYDERGLEPKDADRLTNMLEG